MRPVLEAGISARDRGVARGLLSQPLNTAKDCMIRDEAPRLMRESGRENEDRKS